MESGALATPLILSDLQLPGRAHQHWQHNAIDSLDHCADRKWFLDYPHEVRYDFNSRGFRDQEWPQESENLTQSIWCMGDSFTVGLGSPWSHTWPQCLQAELGVRTINVSMDGASNDWISRRACDIIRAVAPRHMVVMWSYLHRRETVLSEPQQLEILQQLWDSIYQDIRDHDWPSRVAVDHFQDLDSRIRREIQQHHDISPFRVADDLTHIMTDHICLDEHRRQNFAIENTAQQDIDNFHQCVRNLMSVSSRTRIIHCFVPDFCANRWIDQSLAVFGTDTAVVSPFVILDRARDGHHFDVMTSRWLVRQVVALL